MSSGQVQSGAGRWLGHAATALGALATVLGATSWFLSDADGSDLWWHLAAGRHAAEHGAVPLADPFSHTAYGRPWVDHSWLWGRIFWSAYDGHPDLAAALQLALIVALFSLVAWNSWRASRSLLAAGAATWLAAAACHWFLDVRPHVVTLLFTALLLATLRWRHAHWMWPPLFLLWANLHAGFFFGLALLGLDVGLRSVEALRGRSPLPAAAWAGLVAACLAAAVNPWGFTIYTIPWQPLASTPFQTLIEWMPLSPSLDPRTYEGRFGWMALLAFGGVVLFGRQLFPVALALVTGAMAVRARRFVPLFAVCSAPLVAVTLGAALDRAARALRARPSPALRLAAGVLALVVAAALWQDLRIRPRLLQRWTAEEVFPTGAAAYLQGMPDPPRRLFNLYNWGGYLMLAAPRVPIFIDGRAGTVYADEVVRAYVALATARRGWHRELESWGIDAVLVYPETPLA